MEPRTLLGLLMKRAGDNPNSLAKTLRNKATQPQIYRFLNGLVKEPRRSTLEPIANHYKIPLDALFEEAVAKRVAAELGLKDSPALQQAGNSNPSKRPSFASNESQGKTLVSEESGQKPPLIPGTPLHLVVKALNWEQLMDTILREGLQVLKDGQWVEIADDSNGPDLLPGDEVFLQSGIEPVAQDEVLVLTQDGDYLLRNYRKITSKVFEVWAKNDGYGKLRSDTDGVRVVAVVMERKTKRRVTA